MTWLCRLRGHRLTAFWRLSEPGNDGHLVLLLVGDPDGSEDGWTCLRRRCPYLAETRRPKRRRQGGAGLADETVLTALRNARGFVERHVVVAGEPVLEDIDAALAALTEGTRTHGR